VTGASEFLDSRRFPEAEAEEKSLEAVVIPALAYAKGKVY
jgi:hypothetical protein